MLCITASNPKGLPYNHAVEDAVEAKIVIRRIIAQGGEDIAVNGKLIPAETVAFIKAV